MGNECKRLKLIDCSQINMQDDEKKSEQSRSIQLAKNSSNKNILSQNLQTKKNQGQNKDVKSKQKSLMKSDVLHINERYYTTEDIISKIYIEVDQRQDQEVQFSDSFKAKYMTNPQSFKKQKTQKNTKRQNKPKFINQFLYGDIDVRLTFIPIKHQLQQNKNPSQANQLKTVSEGRQRDFKKKVQSSVTKSVIVYGANADKS